MICKGLSRHPMVWALLTFGVIGAVAFGQDLPKIGVVDVNKVLQEHGPTEELLKGFKERVERFKADLADKEKEIDALKSRLQEEVLLLTDEERQKREEQIGKLEEEKEDFLNEMNAVLKPDKRLVQKTVEETLEEKIRPAIQRIGERDGYTLILLVPNDGVLYYSMSVDLTQQVLREMEGG